jgi:GT2 family glycosyltransferase
MPAESALLVSIIVVSYKGGEMLVKCLKALEAQDYTNIEIIVVDNGSGIALEKTLSSQHPQCKWITEQCNQGFAGGTNRGISKASGEFIALVNDDAMFEPTWISVMLKCMQDNPSAGACAGLVVDGNSPDILDSFGVGIALDGMSRQLECGTSSTLSRDTTEVLAFSGCSCLLRKAALDDTGVFDERFFAYCEDTDLSLRIIRAGWKILACPNAKSLHHYSHTGGRFSLRKLYLIERNHQWVALKNFSTPLILLLPICNLWRFLIQIYASISGAGPVKGFVANGVIKVAFTLAKANVAAAFRAPAILLSRLFAGTRKGLGACGFFSTLVRGRMTIADVILSGSSLPTDDQAH